MLVWLNGLLVEASAARIDPADRGLLLADGLFETLRVEGSVPVDADAHWRRLASGAQVLGLDVPPADLLDRATADLLAANRLDRAALRVTLTRGPAARGLPVPATVSATLLISAAPLPDPPSPARAAVVSVRRNERSPLSRIKSLAYLDQVLALQEARGRGADEAILLSCSGWVSCASAGNLVVRHADRCRTPPVEHGALPGTVRARLLRSSLALEESGVTLGELLTADELCITSSLTGVRSVATLDGAAIGDARPGPLAVAIRAVILGS